ncbi:MAG: hypothetical protein H7066_00890 [Cytophagaceae bacterium]|nr:hypothetical protein [Gemmatimonadaceae bacterium]
MRRRFLAVLCLATLSCQQEPTVPKIELDPVSITLSVSTQTLRAGEADTIRVVVTNNFDSPVRLTFPTPCQVFITIRSQAGDIVTPRDGRPGCLAVSSQLTLALGGSQTFTTIWTGGYDFRPPDTSAKVPPGSYFVSAALIANGYSTLAPAFKVDVQ